VYAGLGQDSAQPLFDDEGAGTPYLQTMLDFLQAFHVEAQRTSDFATRLRQLGLLVPKVITVERTGQAKQSLQGLWTVDPVKLRGLDDVRVVELFRNGYLAWIEAHLISLGSLARLVDRTDQQTAVSDEAGQVLPTPEGAVDPAVQ
ncbi:MAG TPA: SapC family protein, partial [Rubrivivax sp.]|nr:SapC family protein [Rubrivivax sp.]